MGHKQRRQIPREDFALIARIADKALTMAKWADAAREPPKWVAVFMAISQAHKHSPLDLRGLFDADLMDFAHDVFGILRHIDRDTGAMRDCFVPRYARSNHEAA